MFEFTATYTDQYQLTMAQVYWLKGDANKAVVFDYYFRKMPFNGGYAVFAGLETLLEILEDFCFDSEDLRFLESSGLFHPKFIEYLKGFSFNGNIYSSLEGDLIFPTRPVLQVEANMIEAQLIESILLNILNFQSLIATKASRMRQVAGDRQLIDFGLRRAQGPGGYYASRAAIVGGFDATSNVRAGRDFNIPISGTMAHSFVQSYDDELTAFRDFANEWPHDCVLLVDTYSTLRSGIPNAIKVGKELMEKGYKLKGIRIDSGDLAYLARESRKMLDAAGLTEVKIAVSNQLDEDVIKSLNEQGAPIDVFGVGTKLVVGHPDAALDGVYKLTFANGEPRIKLSESHAKTTLPHKKQVYRVLRADGSYLGADVVALRDEKSIDKMIHPFDPLQSLSISSDQVEPLLHKVMRGGHRLFPARSLQDIRSYSQKRLEKLSDEYKHFVNPHLYKVGISSSLWYERNRLIENYQGKSYENTNHR